MNDYRSIFKKVNDSIKLKNYSRAYHVMVNGGIKSEFSFCYTIQQLIFNKTGRLFLVIIDFSNDGDDIMATCNISSIVIQKKYKSLDQVDFLLHVISKIKIILLKLNQISNYYEKN